MTRFLSGVLGAEEPRFSQQIAQLEQAAGRPGADIRLSEDVKRRVRQKIMELGLDPIDTTAQELYFALGERLKDDERVVRQALQITDDASADDVLGAVVGFLQQHQHKPTMFAIKNSVAKRMLKKKPPKAAMKLLGYRSLESMLRHESIGQLYTAALLAESPNWHKAYRAQYVNLTPADFEQRPVNVHFASQKRWHKIAATFSSSTQHNVLAFREIGAVLLLPLHTQVPGLALVTLLLVLEEMNALRAHSSLTKLLQVRPDFGQRLHMLSAGEALTSTFLAGQTINWRMVQRYFAQNPSAYQTDIFEPHVQPEDLQWRHAEDVIAAIAPRLAFWQGTQSLGWLDGDQMVSCNVLDVALNHCNQRSFGQRVVRYVRDNLWHELMLRYLHHGNLEEALRHQLQTMLDGTVAEKSPELVFAKQ